MAAFMPSAGILLRTFIENRLHIVMSAPALMWLWSRLLAYPARPVDYAILTLVVAFICQWNRLTDQPEDRINCPGDLETALRDSGKIRLFCYAAAASAISLIVVTTSHWPVSAALLLAFALGFFYSTPLMPWKSPKRIKDLFLFKNLSSAFGWSVGTILYPALQSHYVPDGRLLGAFLYMAASTMTYEMIWDMRDVKGDGAAGIHTVPVRMGMSGTKRLVLALQTAAVLTILAGFWIFGMGVVWLFLVLHSLMLMITAVQFDGRLKSSRRMTHAMVIATTLFSILVGVLADRLPR